VGLLINESEEGKKDWTRGDSKLNMKRSQLKVLLQPVGARGEGGIEIERINTKGRCREGKGGGEMSPFSLTTCFMIRIVDKTEVNKSGLGNVLKK